ncbi:MAG: ABC transporter permease [Phycisphaerales bacterium]|nr:ABC transporter permease [Phycisphaerales bacterium]
MAMTDMSIIGRSMTAQLFSTVTTVVTVAIAVALMLVLVSMEGSGRRAFERGSGNMDLLVSRDADPMVAVLNGVFYANAPQAPLAWPEYEMIAQHPLVDFAIPTQQGDSYRGRPVMATTPEFFTSFQPVAGEPWVFTEGGAFKPYTGGEHEVVVGAAAARDLGLTVGDTLDGITHGLSEQGGHVHNEHVFRVVGVLGVTGSAHDRALFVDVNSSFLMHAHDRRLSEGLKGETTVDDITEGDRRITGVYVKSASRPGAQAAASLPMLQSQLRARLNVTVDNPSFQIDKLFRIVGNIDQIFVGMAVVVMVSSAIGIMLALYNSMEQRRRQIAVLRVLGCSRGRICGLVLTESAIIGLTGAAVGVVVSLIAMRLVADVMRARLGLVVEPTLTAEVAMVTVLSATLLASLAGVVPAVMAYRTSVVRNLRPLG